MIGILLNIAWFTFVGLFLLAVAGSIALRYWRERERVRAIKTEQVMESLTFDTTNDHIWDA